MIKLSEKKITEKLIYEQKEFLMEMRKLLPEDHSAMAELTRELINASRVYYGSSGQDVMSDDEFDEKKRQLESLEILEGFYYEGSVTHTVGTEDENTELPKVVHEYPALSLDKFKYRDMADFEKWLADKEGCLMAKVDGCTALAHFNDSEIESVDMIARYRKMGDEGLIENSESVCRLTLLATRGNGERGSDISRNASVFLGLPKTIKAKGKHIFRGECVMSYKEFERINEDANGDYRTPRNLGTATATMQNPEDAKGRQMAFICFDMVYPLPSDTAYNETVKGFDLRYQTERLRYCQSLGFSVVPFMKVNGDLREKVEKFRTFVEKWEYPSDGLVLNINDKVYADSLGNTIHGPRGARALKWDDDGVETVVTAIENSMGPKGKLTPVAIFDPVVLGQGSTVTRASLHNLSIIDNMTDIDDMSKTVHVGVGSRVKVVLAQAIIPQIVAASEGTYEPPAVCPECGEPLQMRDSEGTRILYCPNPHCKAKIRGRLENFFSKDGCEAKGLGPSQIDDICDWGVVTDEHPLSFYKLKEEYPKLPSALDIDGWGEKSWQNILDAIEISRHTTLQKFLYALGIPLVGHDLSKKISGILEGKIENLVDLLTGYTSSLDDFQNTLISTDGIGAVKAASFMKWLRDMYGDMEKRNKFLELIEVLHFEVPEVKKSTNALEGLTFVITGDVYQFSARSHFKKYCEDNGARVSGAVSNKTNYLVINDLSSTTTKAQKARELKIPLITEQQFVDMFGIA